MSYRKILHSEKLITLYLEGKLSKVLSRFRDHINEKNYLGAGTHAASFRYNKGEQVLKLCTKEICYFQHFPLETANGAPSMFGGSRSRSHAEQFKKQINLFGPYLLPIKEILYEDNNVFVYTQDLCDRLNISKIDHDMVLKIFQMVEFLVRKNILLGDIAPNNFGLIGTRRHRQIILYDYHDLQPISVNGQQLKTSWWRGIIKNLTRYISNIYCPRKSLKYERLMENFDEDAYLKIKKDRSLPPCYIKLLFYVSSYRHNVNEVNFCQLLEKCVDFLIEDRP